VSRVIESQVGVLEPVAASLERMRDAKHITEIFTKHRKGYLPSSTTQGAASSSEHSSPSTSNSPPRPPPWLDQPGPPQRTHSSRQQASLLLHTPARGQGTSVDAGTDDKRFQGHTTWQNQRPAGEVLWEL